MIDTTNPAFIAYARAMQTAALAWHARYRSEAETPKDSPLAHIHESAEATSEAARIAWVATNPEGLHTHRIYFCFDNFPELSTRFHDKPGEISCHAYADFYKPQFPELTFDSSSEEMLIDGPLAELQRLASVSELPLEIDPLDPEDLGHQITWDTAFTLLGETSPLVW